MTQHLEHDLRRGEDFMSRRQDLGPPSGVFRVGKPGVYTGPGFDHDLETGLREDGHHRGNHRDPPFAGKDFSRNSDDHETGSDRSILGLEGNVATVKRAAREEIERLNIEGGESPLSRRCRQEAPPAPPRFTLEHFYS